MSINPWEFEKNLPPPPPGYIPGIGRGAMGFVTGSDLGSIATPGGLKRPNDDNDNTDYSDHNFDKWSGFNDSKLFSSTSDKEDIEADKVWQDVETALNARRKKAKMETDEKKANIHSQFSDLKKGLEKVSEDEWMNIPEIGDYTIKKTKFDTYTPVPDTLLQKSQVEHERFSSIDPQGQIKGNQTSIVDMNQLSGVKESILKTKLKKFEDSVSGVTTVNPEAYTSSLNSQMQFSESEIGDLKKIRLLFKSVTQSDPTRGEAWITAAKIEEGSGKITEARNLIMKGLEHCSDQEDVWLEAIRLSTPENAKIMAAQAVQAIPDSINLWLQASTLEKDKKAKKRVLRKALEKISNSVQLWKEAIQLEENEDDARILLGRAVECIPQNSELWLALARLETYENAKRVLNKARQAIPSDPLIWIAASELEEENGAKNSEVIIQKAIKSLNSQNVILDRDQWIKYAEKCEDGNHVQTCWAIIRHTIGNNVPESDREYTWMEDAQKCIKSGHTRTAKGIYAHALSIYTKNVQLWITSSQIEQVDEQITLLKKACEHVGDSEAIWMKLIQLLKNQKNFNACRETLAHAFEILPNSESLWLFAVQLEVEDDKIDRARILLEKSRENASTARIWMKSALFERNLGNFEQEKKILDRALTLFPDAPKLWMMAGQWEEFHGNTKTAQQVYLNGIKTCQSCVPLWKLGIELEQKLGNATRTRALIEKARQKVPKNEDVWMISIRFELSCGMNDTANSYLATALQECPTSGKLWAQSILMEQRAKQNARASLAYEKCGKNVHVMTMIARMFWRDRAFEKANTWFHRAIAQDADFGDAFVYFYKFLLENGKEEDVTKLMQRCVDSNPKHGELWTNITKAPQNHDKKTIDILKMAMEKITCVF